MLDLDELKFEPFEIKLNDVVSQFDVLELAEKFAPLKGVTEGTKIREVVESATGFKLTVTQANIILDKFNTYASEQNGKYQEVFGVGLFSATTTDAAQNQ